MIEGPGILRLLFLGPFFAFNYWLYRVLTCPDVRALFVDEPVDDGVSAPHPGAEDPFKPDPEEDTLEV